MAVTLREIDDLPCATLRACAGLGAWHVLVGCLMLNRTERRPDMDGEILLYLDMMEQSHS